MRALTERARASRLEAGCIITRQAIAGSGPTTIDLGSFVGEVSCPEDGFRVAGGAALCGTGPTATAACGGNVISYSGGAWSGPTPVEASTDGPTSISCASGDFCMALAATQSGRLVGSKSVTFRKR